MQWLRTAMPGFHLALLANHLIFYPCPFFFRFFFDPIWASPSWLYDWTRRCVPFGNVRVELQNRVM